MSVDKLVDSTQLDSDLTSVANAIRGKTGGSGTLAFPADFVSAINGIPTGGGATLTETNIPVSNNVISFGRSMDYLLEIDVVNQELYLATMDLYIDDLGSSGTVYCSNVYNSGDAFFFGLVNGNPVLVEVMDFFGEGDLEVTFVQDFSGTAFESVTVQNFKWYTLE